MKKIFALLTSVLLVFVFAPKAHALTWNYYPNWNISGTWNAEHHYGGNFYTHVNNITEVLGGVLTGSGGWNGYVNGLLTGSSNLWFVTTIAPFESYVTGDLIHMNYDYSGGLNCRGYVDATINPDGSISGGSWHDNCYGERTGEWTTDFVATRIANPTNKEQCKNDKWKNFVDPVFKNQGDCVSYVQSNPKAVGNKTK